MKNLIAITVATSLVTCATTIYLTNKVNRKVGHRKMVNVLKESQIKDLKDRYNEKVHSIKGKFTLSELQESRLAIDEWFNSELSNINKFYDEFLNN